MKLTPIPAAHVDTVWHKAKPLIARACSHTDGAESVDDLYQKVKGGNGYILVMVDDDTAMIFERAGRFLHVVSMGGRNIVSRINQLVDACWLVAGYVGCTGISFKGRRGWNKLLAPHGFKHSDGYMEVTL